MAKKSIFGLVLLILIALGYVQFNDEVTGMFTGSDSIIDDQKEIPEENTSIDPVILFCPRDDCSYNIEYLVNNSEKIHCAFFDLDIPELIDALERKKANVVVDADNFDLVEGKITNLKKDTRSAFMHNKFCILDDKIVITGSMNPTYNGDEKNNNNVVVYHSRLLAENYEAEFSELWEGDFGKGSRVAYEKIILDGKLIENYFCPEDFCSDKVLKVLSEANESIYFMTFSFTHDSIGNMLIESFNDGVDVKGVFENRQKSKYSEHHKFNESGIDFVFDSNPATMHHKVFIIDEKIVVTGSFNPSVNGDTRNDENVLIIHDENVAEEYILELDNLFLI